MRRFFIPIVLSAVLVSGAATAASTPEYSWKGSIKTTYLKVGGEAKLGTATSNETKIVVAKRKTYHQHTRKGDHFGTVFYSPYLGGKTWLTPTIPNIAGVSNERDALSRYGFKPILYRSAKLCNVSKGGKQLMTTLLHNGLLIDMRTSKPAKQCPDPNLPTVKEIRIPIPSHAIYTKYVTGKTEREGFSKVITAFAKEPDAVWIHCTVGKDRTGWAVAMIMYAGGASDAEVMAEFKRTAKAPTSKLTAGLDTAKAKYGSIDGYLRHGLKLSQTTIDQIRAKKINP